MHAVQPSSFPLGIQPRPRCAIVPPLGVQVGVLCLRTPRPGWDDGTVVRGRWQGPEPNGDWCDRCSAT
jgi:hypothetical protein